jgi:hypothetical protein
VQEDAARPGEILGDDGVQKTSSDPSLDDETSEPRARGELFVVVKGIAITGNLGEELDVARGDLARPVCGVPDLQ